MSLNPNNKILFTYEQMYKLSMKKRVKISKLAERKSQRFHKEMGYSDDYEQRWLWFRREGKKKCPI